MLENFQNSKQNVSIGIQFGKKKINIPSKMGVDLNESRWIIMRNNTNLSRSYLQ